MPDETAINKLVLALAALYLDSSRGLHLFTKGRIRKKRPVCIYRIPEKIMIRVDNGRFQAAEDDAKRS